MNCLLVLSLAVLGASAAPCAINFNTCSVPAVPCSVPTVPCSVPTVPCSTTCGTPLPGRNIFSQTPIIEHPARPIPGYIPETSVSQSCHGLKTVVRPQIRNEIISVPHVDRIVRVVPSPVVETVSVNVGGNTRTVNLPTCGVHTGVVPSGVVGLPVFGGVVNTGCGCGSIVV